MPEKYSFTVLNENTGERLDKFLTSVLDGFTRSAVQKIIDDGGVFSGSTTLGKNYKLKEGETIDVVIPDAIPLEATPENIPLDIVYEDDDLLVVNKPKGMVVHPANGNITGTLVNALMYHCGDSLSGINGVIRPGIVHRIDKNTSGLLIVAKNDLAHVGLALQIKNHSFTRAYEAVVYGNIKEDEGTVNEPIGRSTKDRKKMAVTLKNSKSAVTHYKVIQRYGEFTHVRCELETGRTHQIRVHMAHIGHPVAGDDVYGPKKVIRSLNGQCLHAKLIGFTHPRTGEYMEFESPLPEYFTDFLRRISNGKDI